MNIKAEALEFNEAFTRAYDVLENTERHVFVSGKAGTGKSTLLEYFRSRTLKEIAVLAPTGVAAVNVRGQTIHSFFQFRLDVTPDTVPLMKVRRQRRRLYAKLQTLVIDEISMVRADLLDCVDVFLRLHGRRPEKPFGGVQMVFFGDLYQLPPVVRAGEEDLFAAETPREGYPTPYFFSSRAVRDEAFDWVYVELTKVYRQRQDYFVKLLNRVRDNSLREEHLRFLNQRCRPAEGRDRQDFYVYLSPTNAMVDRINRQKLARLTSEEVILEGCVEGDFPEKDLPAKPLLALKEGAQVMLLNNDPSGRWVNGSIGRVMGLEGGISSREAITVILSDGRIEEVKPFKWEAYQFFFNEDTLAIESRSVGSFTQYPLALAWAITIHKSQGKTFDRVILDLGAGTFAHGQLYVALSRCTDFDGLILRRPVRRDDVILDERVVQFMRRLVQTQGDGDERND